MYIFQAEDDEDEQMDQDDEPQMQVVLHEVEFLSTFSTWCVKIYSVFGRFY